MDKLATATLVWLTVRRRHFIAILLSEKASRRRRGRHSTVVKGGGRNQIDPEDLEASTVRLVAMLQDAAFEEEETVAASTRQSKEAVRNGEKPEYNLRGAVADCLAAAGDLLEKVRAPSPLETETESEDEGEGEGRGAGGREGRKAETVVQVDEDDVSPTLTASSVDRDSYLESV